MTTNKLISESSGSLLGYEDSPVHIRRPEPGGDERMYIELRELCFECSSTERV